MTTIAIANAGGRSARPVGWWLILVAIVIFAMMIWGGYTRRTDSGLSMVQWHPISGVIPPMTRKAWQAEFDNYKKSPQYQDVNKGMTLAAFKRIFWVEYLHRVLGRIIAVIFALPLAYFFLTRRIGKGLALRLLGIFVLGGLQGLLGWYMVRSGLHNAPAVSPYRLTAHLGLAVVLYGLVLWVAFSLLGRTEPGAGKQLKGFGFVVLGLILLQILMGGLMSGFHAGLIDNTWPLMNGRIVPRGLFAAKPWWLAPVREPLTIQFDHRILAYIIVAAVAVLWWRSGKVALGPRARLGRQLLFAAVLAQLVIGIFNLLLAAPLGLAVVHLGGALALFTAGLFLAHALWGEPRA